MRTYSSTLRILVSTRYDVEHEEADKLGRLVWSPSKSPETSCQTVSISSLQSVGVGVCLRAEPRRKSTDHITLESIANLIPLFVP